VALATAATLGLIAVTCLIRFGLVAVVAYFLTTSVFTLHRAVLPGNSGAGALILAAIIALTLGAAYVAMGSPKLPRGIGPS
jgi:hypothetical protein